MSRLVETFPLILLVGGKSSRMGQSKGLLPYRDDLWLSEQLRCFAVSGGRRVVIVLGHRYEDYRLALPWLENAQEQLIESHGLMVSVCINDVPELGPFSSIQAGARSLLLDESPDGVFIQPIDVPSPSREVWTSLSLGYSGQTMVCVPRYEESGGHPVLLSTVFLQQILALSPGAPEARLDRQICKLPPECVAKVIVDDSRVRMNLNTPERWREFILRQG